MYVIYMYIQNIHMHKICTVGQKKKEKKRNTPIYFNTNYRTEMKLVNFFNEIIKFSFQIAWK